MFIGFFGVIAKLSNIFFFMLSEIFFKFFTFSFENYTKTIYTNSPQAQQILLNIYLDFVSVNIQQYLCLRRILVKYLEFHSLSLYVRIKIIALALSQYWNDVIFPVRVPKRKYMLFFMHDKL